MRFSLDEIRQRVDEAVMLYNDAAKPDDRIERVMLFGSYARLAARDDSDVDLLVTFSSPVVSLLTLGRALETLETCLGVSVDLVQDPLPEGALLEIKETVPLYEAA